MYLKKTAELCEVLWKAQDAKQKYNLGLIFELGLELTEAAFPKDELVYMKSLVEKERWRALLRRIECQHQKTQAPVLGSLAWLTNAAKN